MSASEGYYSSRQVGHYRVSHGSVVGPGLDETEDPDCQLALQGASKEAESAIVRLLEVACRVGERRAQRAMRIALGIDRQPPEPEKTPCFPK
jgi:hypothetical protein